MRRLARFVRASILPLFALASVALFAWGVAGWWKFHRDLFVEEEAALVALAQETGTLRYRRAGSLRTKLLDARGLDDSEPRPVPWSVPFVGRVEFIDASASVEPRTLGDRLANGTYPLGYAVNAYWEPTAANAQANVAAAMAAAAAAGGPPAPAMQANQNPGIAASLSPSAALAPSVFPAGTFASTTTPRTTPAARDRALRLPGLKEFRDLPPVAIDAEPIDLATLSLTLPPPKFPTAYLHPDHLDEPFPSGEAVEASERETLAAEIADVWSQRSEEDPLQEKPRLICVHRRTIDDQSKRMDRSTSIRLRDGERRFDFSALPHELDASIRRPANVRVSTETGEWEFVVTKTLSFPTACRLFPEGKTFDDAPDLPHSLGRPFDPYGHMEPLPDDPLGDEGRYVVAMERIDRQRLRIEAQSAEEDVPEEEWWRFRAVVRTDYDYAIEQFDWYLRHAQSRPDPSTPRELIYREIRWLSRRKGTTIVTERLSDPWPVAAAMAPGRDANASLLDEPPPARVATHSLIATTFDPIYPKEIFDPAMYGAKTWATPRELPAYRFDQIAMGAGALGLAFAATFAFVRGIFVRRRGAGVDRRGSFLAFRFGMITALAVALFAISAAGWLKVRVDEARDQQALLAELARLDERIRFERGEPEFPWLFVSTEEFPIGTQLTRVDLGPQPSPELLDGLLASSPDLRLEIRERGRSEIDRRLDLATPALGHELPEFESFDWGNERLDDSIERGVPLTPEENDKSLAEMLAAWRRAKENRPTRYQLRQETSVGAIRHGFAIRDGSRSWSIVFGERGPRIDADDGHVRRRFLYAGDDWQLVDRRPSSEGLPPFYAKPERSSLLPPDLSSVLQGAPYDAAGPPRVEASDVEPALIASTAEIVLPEPPFLVPPGIETTYRPEDRFASDPAGCSAEFERLPAGDLRAHLTWGERLQPHSTATWTLVVRPDLDWCVEKAVIEEAYERDLNEIEAVQLGKISPYGRQRGAAGPRQVVGAKVRFSRKIYCRNALDRRDGYPVLLEARVAAGESLSGSSIGLSPERVRYAVDLDPPIVPERFDRPTLDSPEPPRRVEPWLPWHRATFFVGIGLLGYAGVRRVIDVWTARRRKKAKPERFAAIASAGGLDAKPEHPASDVSPTSEAPP